MDVLSAIGDKVRLRLQVIEGRTERFSSTERPTA